MSENTLERFHCIVFASFVSRERCWVGTRDEPLTKSAWEVSQSHAPVNLHFVIQCSLRSMAVLVGRAK